MLLAAFVLICLIASGAAFADQPTRKVDPNWFYGLAPDPPPGWQIDGSIASRWEYFAVLGDRTQSPYPVLGLHPYTDIALNGFRRVSPYEFLRTSLNGVVSYSDYRTANERAFILERASLFWQKGDVKLPFRLRVGDYYSFLSVRTLQQALKGVQVELQPNWSGFMGEDARHSFVVFSGLTHPTYRNFEERKEVFSGGSWLVSGTPLGDFALNIVQHRAQQDLAAGQPQIDQYIASFSGERSFELPGQRITLEGELAGLFGDVGSTFQDLRQRRRGLGMYVMADGRGKKFPFNWSVLYEQFGRDYAPRGSAVTADRRTYEARAGWRFKNAVQLTGRFQRFEDGWEGDDRLDTMVYGVNLTGPFTIGRFPIPGLSGTFDGFYQDRSNRTKTTADRTISLTLNLTAPINKSTSARFGAFYTLIDAYRDARTSITREASFGLDRSFQIRDFNGTISPGVVVRKLTGADSDSDQIGPSLSLSLAGKGHEFSGTYTYLFLDGHTALGTNTHQHSAALRYSYSRGPHTIGLEFDFNGRSETPGTRTEGYKGVISYTYRFRREAAPARRGGTDTTPAGSRELDIAALKPGLPLFEARRIIEMAGIGGGVSRGNLVIYEGRIFDRVDARQRLVLVHRNERLERTVVVIDIADAGNPRLVERLYGRVLSRLAKRYGSPSPFERGRFAASFVQDVNAGRLIRTADWSLPGGGMMRVGIPQRLDRQVRIEVQVGSNFPSPRVTRWGLEPVR